MESIGVRELRQNASRYLEIVAAGASVQVTSHGRPVALLTPVGGELTRADLIARGSLVPGRGSLLDVVPVPTPPDSPDSAALLAEMRHE